MEEQYKLSMCSNLFSYVISELSRSNQGRKRWKDNGSTPIAKAAESLPAPSRSAQKWNKGNTDKRPRQRGYFGNRQREEVAYTSVLRFNYT